MHGTPKNEGKGKKERKPAVARSSYWRHSWRQFCVLWSSPNDIASLLIGYRQACSLVRKVMGYYHHDSSLVWGGSSEYYYLPLTPPFCLCFLSLVRYLPSTAIVTACDNMGVSLNTWVLPSLWSTSEWLGWKGVETREVLLSVNLGLAAAATQLQNLATHGVAHCNQWRWLCTEPWASDNDAHR